MNQQSMLEERDRGSAQAAARQGTVVVDALSGDQLPFDAARGTSRAAVFPAPLTTIIAAAMGGMIGVGAIYGVAARLANTLVGVAVIVLVFALTMAGPRVHATAESELGRTVAVVLEAIAFGGVLGAAIVLL